MAELFSEIVEVQNSSNQVTIRLNANANSGTFGTDANAGSLIVLDAAGNDVFRFNGSSAALRIGNAGNEGDLIVRDDQNRQVIHLDGGNAVLRIGENGNGGNVIVHDGQDREVFLFDADGAVLRIGTTGNEGDLIVRDNQNREVFNFDGRNAALRVGASGNEGDIIVRNSDGTEVIHLDGGSGDIILRNADCAEDFDLAPATSMIEPGMVMVLDQEGTLRPSSVAYDKRVAGVISGAGACKPAIVLNRHASARHRVPLALVGRVYCMVDATQSSVEVGDLLTTSSTSGHAMKATDPLRAFGAVIGKALQPFSGCTGMIPILVALQ